jgi:transcriptional regulator with XRE-family HTH domain
MDGKALRALRLEKGLTQGDFAKILGISLSSVSMMERGERRVTDRVRIRIAKVFEITDGLIEIIKRSKRLEDLE